MPTNMDLGGNSAVSVARPSVRRIGVGDLGGALAAGWQDFRANPTHLVFLGLIYPVVGLVLGRMASGHGALPLVYPLLAGFVLIGPFAAVGLYELSRRRERGLTVSVANAFDVRRSPQLGAILVIGALLSVIFLVWLRTALAISDATLPGSRAMPAGEFVNAVLTSSGGWTLIVVGTAVGFVFALVVLTLSVVSFPLLLDRDLGPTIEEQTIVALQTSARAVLANPIVMAVWGLVVAIGIALGFVTLFVGLAVIVPVLGHATWHLYRKVIGP